MQRGSAPAPSTLLAMPAPSVPPAALHSHLSGCKHPFQLPLQQEKSLFQRCLKLLQPSGSPPRVAGIGPVINLCRNPLQIRFAQGGDIAATAPNFSGLAIKTSFLTLYPMEGTSARPITASTQPRSLYGRDFLDSLFSNLSPRYFFLGTTGLIKTLAKTLAPGNASEVLQSLSERPGGRTPNGSHVALRRTKRSSCDPQLMAWPPQRSLTLGAPPGLLVPSQPLTPTRAIGQDVGSQSSVTELGTWGRGKEELRTVETCSPSVFISFCFSREDHLFLNKFSYN